MPEWLSRLYNDLSNVWGKLSTAQRWLVGGLSAALLISLVGISLAVYVLPGGELLYGGLSESELANLVQFLDEKGVSYQIEDNGTSVHVYGDRDKLRAEFAYANRNKPLGGYKVLVGPHWSQTNQQFKETRLRAMQEELEITLEQGSSEIEWARVQLTERQRGLFPSGDTKPTASVKVGTGGSSLTADQVQGIQWLVANSLPGLAAEDVVVTDESNRILEGYSKQSETERLSTEELRAERSVEKKIIESLAAILDPIVGGSSNYTISALVDLDFDRTEIVEKTIDSESPFEKRRMTEEMEEVNQSTGGVPGTPTNNPADRMGANQSSGDESRMTQESRESEYEPRLTRETHTKVAPGKLLSQRVSVAVNHVRQNPLDDAAYVARTQEEMKLLESQLKAAVGHIDDSEKFQFFLAQYPFDVSEQQIAAAEARRRRIMHNVESGVFLLMAIVSIIIFFIFLRKVFSLRVEEEMEEETVSERVEESARSALAEFGLTEIGDVENLKPEEKKLVVIREQVEEYAKGHPEDVANIIKNWIGD